MGRWIGVGGVDVIVPVCALGAMGVDPADRHRSLPGFVPLGGATDHFDPARGASIPGEDGASVKRVGNCVLGRRSLLAFDSGSAGSSADLGPKIIERCVQVETAKQRGVAAVTMAEGGQLVDGIAELLSRSLTVDISYIGMCSASPWQRNLFRTRRSRAERTRHKGLTE